MISLVNVAFVLEMLEKALKGIKSEENSVCLCGKCWQKPNG
jgi:hypothetical protein